MTAKGGVGVVIGQQNGKKEKKSCSVKLEQANLAMMMKKIFLTIASVALMSNSNVWALAGGPFDNGDPGGLLMERGGFYQCQFSFENGNGYGIFTADSYLGGNLPNANQAAGSSNQQIGVFNRGSLYTPNSGAGLGHNANRSVFYFKGVTYVGGCFGFMDMHARQVQGTCNASSNEDITQQTLSQNTGGLINASQTAQTFQPLVINAEGSILNLGWTGKVISSRPNLRFRGKGELTVVTVGKDVKQLATKTYSDLLNAITNSLEASVSVDNPPAGYDPFGDARQAIEDSLNDLNDILKDPNFDSQAPPEVMPVRVTGNRRFF
jgi:hypothetical protein